MDYERQEILRYAAVGLAEKAIEVMCLGHSEALVKGLGVTRYEASIYFPNEEDARSAASILEEIEQEDPLPAEQIGVSCSVRCEPDHRGWALRVAYTLDPDVVERARS